MVMGNPVMMMTAIVMMGNPVMTMAVMIETGAKMDTTGRRERKGRGRIVVSARTALGADVAAAGIATTALAIEGVTMKEKVVTIMENMDMVTSMDMVTGVAVDMDMAMVMDEADTKRKLDEQPPTREDEKTSIEKHFKPFFMTFLAAAPGDVSFSLIFRESNQVKSNPFCFVA